MKVFNNEFKIILKDYPNTDSSILLMKMVNANKDKNYDFYTICDNLTIRIGVDIWDTPIYNKYDRLIGYLPRLRYNEGNLVNKRPKVDDFGFQKPIPRTKCLKILANEFINVLLRIENIDKYLTQ